MESFIAIFGNKLVTYHGSWVINFSAWPFLLQVIILIYLCSYLVTKFMKLVEDELVVRNVTLFGLKILILNKIKY